MFTLEIPDGDERGIRVRCTDHDVSEEFRPGYRTIAFACERCGTELELTAHDLHDWRELTELC